MRPNDIKDLAFDVGLERPHIAVREEWDSSRMCILSYGPLAYRQTMHIDAKLSEDAIRAKLEAAKAPNVVGMSAQRSPSYELPKVETLVTTKEYTPKQWTPEEVKALKPAPKRKKANASSR